MTEPTDEEQTRQDQVDNSIDAAAQRQATNAHVHEHTVQQIAK